MPFYTFVCSCRKKFEENVPIADRDKKQKCPKCGKKQGKRVFEGTTNLISGFRDDTQGVYRKLHQMNKKMQEKQDSQGYGPFVDQERARTKRKIANAPGGEIKRSDLTPKEWVATYKELKRNRKVKW